MEKQEKNNYELSFMLRSEDEAGNVKKILERSGGKVTEEAKVVKVRLAYPIKKETLAFFGYFLFEADAGVAHRLKKDLSLNDGVLRFLLVKPVPATGKAEISKPPKAASPEPAPPPAKAEVLSNEALERTLEEILK